MPFLTGCPNCRTVFHIVPKPQDKKRYEEALKLKDGDFFPVLTISSPLCEREWQASSAGLRQCYCKDPIHPRKPN